MAKDDRTRPLGESQEEFPSKEVREFSQKLSPKAHALAERICSRVDLEFPFSRGVFEQIEDAFYQLSKRLALAEWCLANKRDLTEYQIRAISLRLMAKGEFRDEP